MKLRSHRPFAIYVFIILALCYMCLSSYFGANIGILICDLLFAMLGVGLALYYYKFYLKFQVITGSIINNTRHLIITLDGDIIYFEKFEPKTINQILVDILHNQENLPHKEVENINDAISVNSNFLLIHTNKNNLKEIKVRYLSSNIIISIINNVQNKIIEYFTAFEIRGFISYRSEIISHNLSDVNLNNLIKNRNDISDKSFFITPNHDLIADNISGDKDYNIGVFFTEKNDSDNLWNFFQKSSIASAILDIDLNLILSNQHFNKILGVTDFFGRNFSEFIDIEDQDLVKKLLSKRERQETSSYVELEINNTGKAIHLHINYIVSNKRKYYVFTLIDTTKYKTMEVNSIHAQKMQAIGQLSGAIAHDFNNLLTGMIGFCDLLLQRHPVGDRSFAELMQIKQNANRAANLVRQLLAFSRKQVLQPKISDTSAILSDLSSLIIRLIGENIQFDIHYGEDVDLVKVDQGQLEQVIVNLVVNARDAMPEGGKLQISTSNVVVDSEFDESEFYAPAGDESILFGNYVLIEISDTGHGIPIKVLDKIFSPFFSTKSPGAGTGLGLSTVYGIITQTKGYVRLKTSPNSTSFYIFLKSHYLKEDSELIAFNESLEDVEDKLPSRNISDCGKILIVEDEAPVRTFSAQALSNKGYNVLQADCPETALKIIDAERELIELIISDIMMPGMTGPQMMQKVFAEYPKVKVIFVSGYAEDALSDYKFSNSHFLAKPYSLKQLVQKVQELMLS